MDATRDALRVFGLDLGRCVYFALGHKTLRVKIGTTYDLGDRFDCLAIETRQPLELLAAVPGDHLSERLTHFLFDAYVAEGREWFFDCAEIREFIAALPPEFRPVGLVRHAPRGEHVPRPRGCASTRSPARRHGHEGIYDATCARCTRMTRPGRGMRTAAIEAQRLASSTRGPEALAAAIAAARNPSPSVGSAV